MIFTIGHTIQSLDDFYDMLQHYDVNCIIDVRSMPFSKHAPQFLKDAILCSQYRAAKLVIGEQLSLYFGIGGYVSAHSRKEAWGTSVLLETGHCCKQFPTDHAG